MEIDDNEREVFDAALIGDNQIEIRNVLWDQIETLKSFKTNEEKIKHMDELRKQLEEDFPNIDKDYIKEQVDDVLAQSLN